MRLVIFVAGLFVAALWNSAAFCGALREVGGKVIVKDAIPFEVFASFKRIPQGNPTFYRKPPEWAASTSCKRSSLSLGCNPLRRP